MPPFITINTTKQALYGASNVMQEVLVKAHDRAEFLGMLGGYGAAVSFVQVGVGNHSFIHSASGAMSSVVRWLVDLCLYTRTYS